MLEPFACGYMINATWGSALVGGVCEFLSAYPMLKGWPLIGDALSHSVVPGVAGARVLGLPFALGAFLSGGLAARTVAAMQTAGAFLVAAMVVTPGAIASLLTDRFPRLLILAATLGAVTGLVGADLFCLAGLPTTAGSSATR